MLLLAPIVFIIVIVGFMCRHTLWSSLPTKYCRYPSLFCISYRNACDISLDGVGNHFVVVSMAWILQVEVRYKMVAAMGGTRTVTLLDERTRNYQNWGISQSFLHVLFLSLCIWLYVLYTFNCVSYVFLLLCMLCSVYSVFIEAGALFGYPDRGFSLLFPQL
jgi:hypothetical protein